MLDNWNRIISNLLIAEKGACSNIAFLNGNLPENLPCIWVDPIDSIAIAEDLENSENAVESIIELHSYSETNLTEAQSIMETASDAMRRMGYRRRMGPKQIVSPESSNIFHMTSRFSRVLGNGEEIKRFEEN